MLKVLIATARFPHIIRILARLRHPAWIIAVIINHATEHRISFQLSASVHVNIKLEGSNAPHPPVNIHRDLIPGPHIQIHKPSVVYIRPPFKSLRESSRETESPPCRRNSEDGDVPVPRGVVLGVAL